MNELKVCIKRTFDFRGRSTRREFFLGLLNLAVALVFVYQAALIVGKVTGEYRIVLLTTVYAVLVCISVTVRRIHDVGKPWFWVLIPVYGVVLLFRDSQDTENEWGLDPKSEYGIDDFVSTSDFYRYVERSVKFKYCLGVSILLFLVRGVVATVGLVSVCYSLEFYEQEVAGNYFDLDGVRIDTSWCELSPLSVKDVCILVYEGKEYAVYVGVGGEHEFYAESTTLSVQCVNGKATKKEYREFEDEVRGRITRKERLSLPECMGQALQPLKVR